MNFENKVIWITGASSGIGKALAIQFSGFKIRLILSSRNKKELLSVRSKCQNPENVKVLAFDLLDTDRSEAVVSDALALFNGIDILVNNAGISQRSMAAVTGPEVDRMLFNVNFFGTVALTKALLPHLKSKQCGQVVVISSVVGKIGTPLRSSYAASKHALHGFFDSLRAEIYQDNIGVTIICPGFVNTNISVNALTADGSPQGTKDQATARGLSPEKFAKKAIKAIAGGRQEVVIAGYQEKSAVYLKRFFPLVLSAVIRKVKVT
jgi:short-subunit dehydrogenase